MNHRNFWLAVLIAATVAAMQEALRRQPDDKS
jgi:hypothetical protein